MTVSKRLLYTFWSALVVTLAIVVLMNFGYFYSQAKYATTKQEFVKSSYEAPTIIGEPNMLSIPSLGISAPIQYPTEKNESSFQESLKNGVVHYPDTALPGEFGNVYIFGHSSDYSWSKGKYKNVFALLPKIKNGEKIIVSNGSGRTFEYVVSESKVVEKNDLSVLSQGSNDQHILTLQTSYPLGTALKRYIVVAELN